MGDQDISAMNIALNDLISHRFRGFSKHENSLEGLRAALDFGVLTLEFDVRVAACGTPMVYHDEYAYDQNGDKRFVCDVKASSFKNVGGAFAFMPSLDDVFAEFASRKNPNLRLLVDIKDQGFEEEIFSLVHAHGLQTQTVFVSWIPEVLYRLHEMDMHIPLCLSHWCGPVNDLIRASHIVHVSQQGYIPRDIAPRITGVRSGWSVLQPLKGDMLDMLMRCGGGICVPQYMLTRKIAEYYHGHSLFVSTFSYTDWPSMQVHKAALGVDMYFIDNKQVFQDLPRTQ